MLLLALMLNHYAHSTLLEVEHQAILINKTFVMLLQHHQNLNVLGILLPAIVWLELPAVNG